MSTSDLKEKLTNYIQNIADERKLQAIYTMVEDEIETTDNRLNLVREEREKYLRGEGKGLTWDEVKEVALNKEKRNAI